MTTNLKRIDAVMERHLQLAWNRATLEKLDRHLAVERETQVLILALGADPTPGKYAEWISSWRRRDWLENGLASGIGLREQRRLSSALYGFFKAAPYLEKRFRDIGRYLTIAEVSAASEGVSEAGLDLQACDEREAAWRQTEWIYDGRGWRAVGLSGFDAARFWGATTRWCTSTSESRFDRYRTVGELFVMMTPFGKFQLATPTMEFKDTRDRDSNIASLLSNAPWDFVSAIRQRVVGAKDLALLRLR